MSAERLAFENLGREALIEEARRLGARRPEVMTRVELIDEVLRLGTSSPVERKKVRGFFGIARDLIASVVEQGLNLPDAAAFIRGDVRYEPLRTPQPPVATVTLAEIYGAQGHHDRALRVLDEVLASEADHAIARRLRERLERQRTQKRALAVTARPDDHALVFARTETSTLALYWEIPEALAQDGTSRVVRVVELRPRARGAERAEREVPVNGPSGHTTLSGFEPGSVCRTALAIAESGGFRTLCVGAEISLFANRVELVWAPRKRVDYVPIAERARSRILTALLE